MVHYVRPSYVCQLRQMYPVDIICMEITADGGRNALVYFCSPFPLPLFLSFFSSPGGQEHTTKTPTMAA